MRLTKRRAQAVAGLGNKDQMDVIVHQAPGETARAAGGKAGGNELEIGRAIIVAEEDRQAAVATLRDVVSDLRDDDAG